MTRHLLAITLLAPLAAAALETIDHPDPASFSPGVAKTFEAAQERLRRAEAEGAPSGDDFGLVGMIYHAHEQAAPAGQAYRNAVEIAPSDARWHYFLGMLAADDGAFEEAAGHFERSLDLNAAYIPSRIRRSRALLQAGEVDAAQTLLELLAEDQPGLAVAQADLGAIALQAGRPEEALRRFERALELQPTADRLHYQLGLAHRALGNVEEARAELELQGRQDVVFDDPLLRRMRSLSGSYTYYISLGLQAAANRDFEAATSFMLRAVEANPESPDAWINLARMREATGEPARALEIIQQVIDAHPDNALAYFNRGGMREVAGNERAALDDYRRALERQPDMFEARLLLASGLMRMGEWTEAAGEFDAALELRPGRNELLLYRAAALEASDRCVDAIEVLLELVRRLPEDFSSLMAYARVVATCPEAEDTHRENALNAARNMYGLAPGFDVTTTLAMVEAAVGNFEAAIDYQTQAGFLALREGQEGAVPMVRGNMERFEQGQPAERPWPDDFPYRSPRRLTLEDRL